MKKNLLILFFLSSCLSAFAQTTSLNILDGVYIQEDKGAVRISADTLKWTDTKPPLPPGAKVAVLEGNPKEEGHFTMRIKMPPNYKIPAHMHSVDERATVLSGTMYVGLGKTIDKTKEKKISEGGFYVNPAGLVHYAYTGKEETILQISTNGPWGSTYVEQTEH